MLLEDIFWTTSSFFSCVLEAVEKIAELYSKCVRTSEIYAKLNSSVVSELESLDSEPSTPRGHRTNLAYMHNEIYIPKVNHRLTVHLSRCTLNSIFQSQYN